MQGGMNMEKQTTNNGPMFDVEVLEEVPEGYIADTSAVAGAAGNSCCNENDIPV